MDRTGGAPRVLIIDDDPFKKIGIQKALEFCGVREIVKAKNQQMGFDIIYAGQRDEKPVELIVTDMNYPLDSGMPEDPDAGFRLIERLGGKIWRFRSLSVLPLIITCRRYWAASGTMNSAI